MPLVAVAALRYKLPQACAALKAGAPRQLRLANCAPRYFAHEKCPRQDSNLRPSAPEADALSTELLGRRAKLTRVFGQAHFSTSPMPDLTLAHVSALWLLDKCGPGRQAARTAAVGPSRAACLSRLPWPPARGCPAGPPARGCPADSLAQATQSLRLRADARWGRGE